MERSIKPIGGEFWFENDILDENIVNLTEQNLLLLDGGQSALEYILRDIDANGHEYILMPSYLCPTILYKFKEKNIKILFYEINEDLSVDIGSVKELIAQFNVRALFFIDYFGFYHNEQTLNYFKQLKESGIILIEDAVQMLWFGKLSKFIGDYVFNSYRKFFPCDGSMVLNNFDNKVEYKPIEDSYNKLILEARTEKTEYIKNAVGKEEKFLKKFTEAEEWYYKREDINSIYKRSKDFLQHINYQKVIKQRIENYIYLYEKLKGNQQVRILFAPQKIDDNIPLVFPVLINNRDFVRNELRQYNIYCPVHWDITEEKWAEQFPKSLNTSKRILSLPIDWRYSKKDMQYLLDKFECVLNDKYVKEV